LAGHLSSENGFYDVLIGECCAYQVVFCSFLLLEWRLRALIISQNVVKRQVGNPDQDPMQ